MQVCCHGRKIFCSTTRSNTRKLHTDACKAEMRMCTDEQENGLLMRMQSRTQNFLPPTSAISCSLCHAIAAKPLTLDGGQGIPVPSPTRNGEWPVNSLNRTMPKLCTSEAEPFTTQSLFGRGPTSTAFSALAKTSGGQCSMTRSRTHGTASFLCTSANT